MKEQNDLRTPLLRSVIVSRDGAALIIILAFIVLMLGMLLDFFSQSILQQQVSKTSTGMATADVFARGAAASIIGDLKQEIIAGSTITTNTYVSVGVTMTNYVYAPYTYSNGVVSTVTAMPAISGFSMTNGLENLIKISAGGSNFFPSNTITYPNSATYPPANRASMNLTTTPSRNGRYVSQIRWNQPLLIARQNPNDPTDLTPTNTFTNAIPQWIYVSRNGANPTTWNANLKWSTTNDSTVIGRYAYAIYHEGGLLDANVAGSPPGLIGLIGSYYVPRLTGPYIPYKQGTFFADLIQIGMTYYQHLAFVGWRNNISAKVTGSYPWYSFPSDTTSYATNVLANTNGFLQTYNNGTNSDRQFTSRQQLIAFSKNFSASGLNSLRYLATFTRSLEQPSLIPPTNRPMIVPAGSISTNGWNGNGWDPSTYKGGNDNYGNDTTVNPNFLTILVSNTNWTRNDGSTPVVGEPLVLRRFDLRQLCWLTFRGPSSQRGDGDADMVQMQDNGISTNYLSLGTATNVWKAFGLTFDTTNGFWTYTATNTTANTNVIRTLAQVAALSPAREPNFFELLKASINAGSIGKSAAVWTNGGALYQHQLDITSDYQILQIGADLMDQNDCDGYPTRIQCNFRGGMGTKEIRGIENLPSLYSLTYSFAIKAQSYPPITNTVTGAVVTNISTNEAGVISTNTNALITRTTTSYWFNSTLYRIKNSNPASNMGLNFNPGSIAVYANPNLWNIHDGNDLTIRGTNYALGNPRPTQLAVTITYAPPTTPTVKRTTPLISALPSGVTAQWVPGCSLLNGASWTNVSPVVSTIFASNNEGTNFITNLNSSTYAITFDYTVGGTLYREPTIIWKHNLPYYSDMSYYSKDLTTRDFYDKTDHIGFLLASNIPSLVLLKNPLITKITDTNTGYFITDTNTGYFITDTNTGYFITDPDTGEKIFVNNPNFGQEVFVSNTNYGHRIFVNNTDFGAETFVTNYCICEATSIFQGVCGSNPIGSTNGTTTENGAATISCQLQSPFYGWQTYDEKYWSYILPVEAMSISLYNSPQSSVGNGQYPNASYNSGNGIFNNKLVGFDPRSGRFTFTITSGYNNTKFLDQGTKDVWNAGNCVYGTVLQTNADLAASELGHGFNMIGGATTNQSTNINYNIMFQDSPTYASKGPSNNLIPDYWALNSPWFTNNLATRHAGREFNADPDGVVRRAMGAYVPLTASGYVTNSIGVATVAATTYTSGNFTSNNPTQSQGRPIVLNRPFRTVDEMGYAFRGSPYKNLDFFLPESGDTGLLDTFCVGPTYSSIPKAFSTIPILSSGKVNLNTLQAPVLQALVSCALADELTTNQLNSNDVATIVTALTNRTQGTNPWQGPLANVGDLVGRFIGYNVTGVTPSSPFQTNYYSSMLCSPGIGYASLATNITYAGLSADLGSMTNASQNAILIQRLRQAGLRPFVTQGQTRVWNLMIDLVAQTGRFALAASNLDKFVVEGESHFWFHVAIDRYTGQILDSQLEPVTQ